MESFVREIVKTSLCLICAGGVAMMALGIVILFWPEFVCMVAACSLILAGAFLFGGTVYGILNANMSRN